MRETKTTVICDRCERKLDLEEQYDYQLVDVNSKLNSKQFGCWMNKRNHNWDLCSDCKVALEEFMDKGKC